MTNPYISGWGKCLPNAEVKNHQLEQIIDTSDKWIKERTGIQSRRYSNLDTADMAIHAAREAMACAGTESSDIDFIIVATTTPESLIPNTASKVQQALQANCGCIDINAACSGFIYSCGMASALIQSNKYKNILVIGAEKLSFFINWKKRDTAVLFGDGAGAIILSATDENIGIINYELQNEAINRDDMTCDFGANINKKNYIPQDLYIKFNGKSIFKNAVLSMSKISQDILQKSNMKTNDIDWVIPHQANIRIIKALVEKMGIEDNKVITNIDKYGNTSSASIPIAICEAVENNKIKPYQNILSTTFGAGLSCGAMVYKWGKRVTPKYKNKHQKPNFATEFSLQE